MLKARIATYYIKFKQLDIWTSKNTITSINCESVEHARQLLPELEKQYKIKMPLRIVK